MVRHRFGQTNKMEVRSFTTVVGSSPGHGIFLCLKNWQFFLLCITLLSILAHPFTDCDQKKILWPFSKNEKECLYLWHLCIPWSYAQKIQIIPAPKKKKSLSIYWKKCKGHPVLLKNDGHSSLNVFSYVFFFMFCLFALQWYRKSWPLAFLQLF